ncbi:LuxR family transcriptional regulator [Sphingobacterium sp. E70]|nr:LuxR family transcriptional regulator [Sphingobacterium sp. E70]
MQKIFKLRNEDFTLKEIAVALGLAEQTVKGYSAEMHRRIKAMLIERHPEFARSLTVMLSFCWSNNFFNSLHTFDCHQLSY